MSSLSLRISSIHCSFPPPPPRPRQRRKNHLRPKIKIPTEPSQTLTLTHHQLLLHHQEPPQDYHHLLEAESDPLPVPINRWLPGIVIRFVALLAVQTAVAVWFLGRNDVAAVEEKVGYGIRVPEEDEERVVEFEKEVSVIREMAREARKREVREAEDDDDGVKERIGRGIGRLRRNFAKGVLGEEASRRKVVRFVREAKEEIMDVGADSLRRKNVGFVKPKSKNLSAPKGFNGLKRRNKDANVAQNGGIQQIAEENNVKGSRNLHEPREPNTAASSVLRHVNGSSVFGKDDRKESNSHKYKETFGPQGEPWWAKLPYVLAILLHRRSDSNGPIGFYRLNMNPLPENYGSASYTVLFQDPGDATNFCYLLESFFEDLDDFSADVVPLTVQELEEKVKSDSIKIIVVKKGQIRLYAGQPLTEVETVLRSLV